jgi:hypothetical protein
MNKIKSRKLWAFILWALLGVYMIFSQSDLTVFIPNFMIVTVLYIGGEAAIDTVDRLKKKIKKF